MSILLVLFHLKCILSLFSHLAWKFLLSFKNYQNAYKMLIVGDLSIHSSLAGLPVSVYFPTYVEE